MCGYIYGCKFIYACKIYNYSHVHGSLVFPDDINLVRCYV